MSTMKQVAGWVAWVVVTLAAGWVGNLLSGVMESRFYQQLARPDWAPPSSVFGPVWTVLFIMMGTAAWLVWRERGFSGARFPLVFYLVHLVFNAAWTGIFFGLEAPGWAFAEILVLLAMIVTLIVLFMRVRTLAGILLIPYLLWVSYATALTFALWRMNPDL